MQTTSRGTKADKAYTTFGNTTTFFHTHSQTYLLQTYNHIYITCTLGPSQTTSYSKQSINEVFFSFQSDIYSTGIVLFELFQPFDTEMERVVCIKDVRECKLLERFQEKWSLQV